MKTLLPLSSLLLMLVAPSLSCAQSSTEVQELREEVDELRRSQEALNQSLSVLIETLRPVLEQLPKPFQPQEVSIEGSPVKGKPAAEVTIVEFSDLQCSFCVRFYNETFPKLVENYIDTGKVRYVAREFPLTTIHKEAQRASQAALCAGDNYWAVRDKIFKNRNKLSDEDLAEFAAGAGVEMSKWRGCMETDLYLDKVRRDIRDADKLGVKGTPAFVFGMTDPDNPNAFRAVKLLPGAYPYDEFERVIDGLLAGTGD